MDKTLMVASLVLLAGPVMAVSDNQAPVVSVSLPAGTYPVTQQLTLGINDNSDKSPKLYYTMDGTLPKTSSSRYDGRTFTISETTALEDLYLRTLAMDKSGNWVRNIFKYRIKDSTAPLVTPSLAAGSYVGSQSIVLSVRDSSDATPKIYFTIDGTIPQKKAEKLYQPGTIIVAKDVGKKLDLRLRTLALDTSNNWVRNLFDYRITTNQLPVAKFSSAVSGASAMLYASDSTDSDGNIDAYYWSFGDGQTATGETTYHEFPGPGQYVVELKVIDNLNAEGTAEKIIDIARKKMDAQVTGQLNDTGLTNCIGISGNITSCPNSELPGQDAESGRDVTHAGFSFTKIDADGYPLSADATEWSCIKDNVTGLMWEVKTSDGGLRDKNNTYSWYDPYKKTNAGFSGLIDGGVCSSIDYCDSYHYVETINTSGLCGYTDWRVPTRSEMYSIIDFGAAIYKNADNSNLAALRRFFPDLSLGDIFLTSSPNFYSPLFYHMVGVLGDVDYTTIKKSSGENKLRLVRDGKPLLDLGEKDEPTSENYDEE